MIACAFDNSDRAGIADREALAGHTAEIAFPGYRTIHDGVADNDGFMRNDLLGLFGRVNHNATTRQALADIIIGLAFKLQCHAMRKPCTEALARCAFQGDMHGVIGQPAMAEALGDFTRQHGTRGPIDGGDRCCDANRIPLFKGRRRLFDQGAIEHMIKPVILNTRMINRIFEHRIRLVEHTAEIQPLGFPMGNGLIAIQHLHLAHHFIEMAIAKLGHDLAHFLGNEEEEIDHMLGLANKALAQHRVLGRNTHRAGIEMAFAHHDAACGNQRRCRKAEFIRTQQGTDHHIATCAQPAIDLHGDARTQAVHHKGLMGFGKTDFPWRARMFDRGQRRCPRAALKTGNGDMIRTGF